MDDTNTKSMNSDNRGKTIMAIASGCSGHIIPIRISITKVNRAEFFFSHTLSHIGSSLMSTLLSDLSETRKTLMRLKQKATEEFVPIDQERLREAISIVKGQKNDKYSWIDSPTLSLPEASKLNLAAECGMLLLHELKSVSSCITLDSLDYFKYKASHIRDIQEKRFARKLYNAGKTCLNALRHFQALLRCFFCVRLIDSLVSALHRIFYMPRSTLHMPKDADEDSSNAYRFEQIVGARTWLLCLLLSS